MSSETVRDGERHSRSPHGERGLKSGSTSTGSMAMPGRSPHGERGLKYRSPILAHMRLPRRSPHGERGLKSRPMGRWAQRTSRSPHGERGLKSHTSPRPRHTGGTSLSSWRAWIEITPNVNCPPRPDESLSSWRAWIEMGYVLAWNA